MNRESIHSFDLTSNQLKLLAIVSMVVDHTGAVLFPQYRLLRLIGRAAFPIYVFLLVEGFFHTHSRPKYLLRLSVFALISEVPFDLALYSQAFNGYRCNVFFTLAIGMVLMMLADKLVQSPPASPKELPQALFAVALLMGCFCLADWLKTDYGAAGVLAIGAGYCLARIGLQGGIVFAGIVAALATQKPIEAWAFAALPFVLCYHGSPGRRNKALQYFFYAFYPAHLLVLYLIAVRG